MKKFLSAMMLISTLTTSPLAQAPATPPPPVLIVTGNGQVMAPDDQCQTRFVRRAPARATRPGEWSRSKCE
jgi:hypothetical protein